MSDQRKTRALQAEVENLLNGLRDGSLDEPQSDRLVELLREHPAARGAYVRHMALHADLSQLMGGPTLSFHVIEEKLVSCEEPESSNGSQPESLRKLSSAASTTGAWLPLACVGMATVVMLVVVTISVFREHSDTPSSVVTFPRAAVREELLVGTDSSSNGTAPLRLPTANATLTGADGLDEIGQLSIKL